MPCLLGCIALAFPRFVILLLLIFSRYLERAYDSLFWLLMGFIFLPLSTLAYAFGINQNRSLEGIYLVIFVIAVLLDLGLIGGSTQQGYRKHQYR